MNVRELNKDRLTELKMELYARKHGDTISHWDIVNIDKLVSDEEVFKEAAGCDFIEEDFLCCGAK